MKWVTESVLAATSGLNLTSMHHFEHMYGILREKSARGWDGRGELLYCGARKRWLLLDVRETAPLERYLEGASEQASSAYLEVVSESKRPVALP